MFNLVRYSRFLFFRLSVFNLLTFKGIKSWLQRCLCGIPVTQLACLLACSLPPQLLLKHIINETINVGFQNVKHLGQIICLWVASNPINNYAYWMEKNSFALISQEMAKKCCLLKTSIPDTLEVKVNLQCLSAGSSRWLPSESIQLQ